MPIIKDYEKAKKKTIEISSRFDLSKRKKEYEIVESIVEDVKKRGDKALLFYSKKFDNISLRSPKVSKKELDLSVNKISKSLLASIKNAILRITNFQETNTPKTWIKTFKHGEKLGYKYSPLDSVAVYIPGGHSPLISTVLMTVIPAKVAGVKRIAVFTPPKVNQGILAACKLLGITEVYQVGGAQAIAACAYGTESIEPFCKVVGPGNIYVTLAKKIVFGKIGIDGLFGPSEIAVIADKSANPKFIAIDLLSQLEHGSGLESAYMITDSERLATDVEIEVLRHLQTLPNKEVVLRSWKNNSAIIISKNKEKTIELINMFAPEHLEIITKDPNSLISKILNAGAIFLGSYSCESVGDYVAGPSHCLPTGGSAKFSSGLTVMDFMKKISIISFDRKSFAKVSRDVINLADAEELKAHGDAVRFRI